MNNKIQLFFQILTIILLSITSVFSSQSLTLEEEILQATHFNGGVLNIPPLGNVVVISINYSLSEFVDNKSQRDVSELLLNLKNNENSTITQIVYSSDIYTWVESVNTWFNTQNGFLNASIEDELKDNKIITLDIYRNQQRVFLYIILNINYFEGIDNFSTQTLQDLNDNNALNTTLLQNFQNNLEENYTQLFLDSLTQNLLYSSVEEFEDVFNKTLQLTLAIQEFDSLSNENNLINLINSLNNIENLSFENQIFTTQLINEYNTSLSCYKELNSNKKEDFFNTLNSNTTYLTLSNIKNTSKVLCNIKFEIQEILIISNNQNTSKQLTLNNFESLDTYYNRLNILTNNSNFIIIKNNEQIYLSELINQTNNFLTNLSSLNTTHQEQLFIDIKANSQYNNLTQIMELSTLISSYYSSLENIVKNSRIGNFTTSKLNEIQINYINLETKNISSHIHTVSNENSTNNLNEEIEQIKIKITQLNTSVDIISNLNINLINSVTQNSTLFNSHNELFEIINILLNFEKKIIDLINDSKENQFSINKLIIFNNSLIEFENLSIYNTSINNFKILEIISKLSKFDNSNISSNNTIEIIIQKDLFKNKDLLSYNYIEFENTLLSLLNFRILENKLLESVNQENENISFNLTIIQEIINELQNIVNSSLNSQNMSSENLLDLQLKLDFINEVSKKPRFQSTISSLNHSIEANFHELFSNIWNTIEQNLNPTLINNSNYVYNNVEIKGISNNTYFSIIEISENQLLEYNVSTYSNSLQYFEIIGFVPINSTVKIIFEISSFNNFENFSILYYNLTQKQWIECSTFATQNINQTHINCKTSHFSFWTLQGDEIIAPSPPSNSGSSGGGGGGSSSSSNNNWNTPLSTNNENNLENITNEGQFENSNPSSNFNSQINSQVNQTNNIVREENETNLTLNQDNFEEFYEELIVIDLGNSSNNQGNNIQNNNPSSLAGYLSLNAPSIISFLIGTVVIGIILVFFVIKK
ncbi:MAG: hypothetical protein LAT82_05975 [Nanoarchaeota archaeon]|nr:hypothetical protein [Nanoarchaeota archaeon]